MSFATTEEKRGAVGEGKVARERVKDGSGFERKKKKKRRCGVKIKEP